MHSAGTEVNSCRGIRFAGFCDTGNSTLPDVHPDTPTTPNHEADSPIAPKGRIETKRRTLEAMAWLLHCTMSRVQ